MSTSLICPTCGAVLEKTATLCTACGVSRQNLLPTTQMPASSSPAVPASPCTLPRGFLLYRRYRILGILGQGGFATVYKARDRTQHGKIVAIKQFHLEMLSLQAMLDATDAYNREVNALSLLRNRSLPRIYAHFMDEPHWYIAMEYIAGKTLEEKLATARKGFLPVNQVLDIGLALCDALQHLHRQQPPLIFRDVKPANILLTRSGKLYLIDFGTTRGYRPGWKDTGPLGTPGYAAPEQYGKRAHTTPQTDIYGLGATLQTLLTGKDPLDGQQQSSSSGQARRIPPRLLDELVQMQERNATARPRNMAEVKQVLQEIRDQTLTQKIKAAATFTRELLNETSSLSISALIFLIFINIVASINPLWWLLWVISLVFMGGFTTLNGVLKMREAGQAFQASLSLAERISIIWKQLTFSLLLAPLVSLFIYCLFTFFYSYENGAGDLISPGIIVVGGLIAFIGWITWRLASLRAAHRRARQTKQQILIHQHIHNQP